MTPSVSVLLATYNNVRELPHALRSLQAQTMRTFEVVAIDDGSTDGSGEILDCVAAGDARFRVIHQENAGLAQALRRACGEARGTLLARQDADDVSAPTRLARQVAYLEAHPRVAACGTWSWTYHPVDGVVQAQRIPDHPERLRRYLINGWNPFVHGSVMMHRYSYDRAAADGGGYRMQPFSEDYDLWLQLSEHGDLGMVESEEYLYLLNAAGMTFGADAKGPLVRLSQRLADERRQYGAERSAWEEEMQRLVSSVRGSTNHSEREATAAYMAGIVALRAGRYARFRAHMQEAAQQSGAAADRARQRLRLSAFAPALRALYALRLRGTPLEHNAGVPQREPLPDWVRDYTARIPTPNERSA